ncbi:MAG: DUF4430 domain-containing protein [Clostridium sp.]|uniref:DUF4430 domain-containing protein n=1 Tax=Clostridium sp. TaxID=1506 RepID=UPI003F2C4903
MKKIKKQRMLAIATLIVILIDFFNPIIVLAIENKTNNTITFSVEQRVLGKSDIVGPTVKSINVEEQASVTFDKLMKELNLKYENTGTLEKNFYISSIEINEGEKLEEFGHGAVSGWKYSVNGIFPSVGLSDYKFNAGDVVRIVYTAKDMGKDIEIVDKIFEIREKLEEIKKLNESEYTTESFGELKKVIEQTNTKIPTDKEIGEMMSVTLGKGDCNTYTYKKEMEDLYSSLVEKVNNLQKRPEQPELKPDFEIDIFSGPWSENDFNTIYLNKDEETKNILLKKMTEAHNLKLNGEKVEPVNGKYVVKLNQGINKLGVTRWGSEYVTTITVRKISYQVIGNVHPGETITIKFDGLDVPIKHVQGNYELERTNLEYSSDIVGLKKIESEIINGSTVDLEKLSKLTFTIPKETEIGEYTLKNGTIYQDWFGVSLGGYTHGYFSKLPEIKLNITKGVDTSKAKEIEFEKWSNYDKVFILEDKIQIKLSDIEEKRDVKVNSEVVNPIGGKYVFELSLGQNKVSVDGKEKELTVKKVSYDVLNKNKITPGSKVEVQLSGIEESVQKESGRVNPNGAHTRYNTNLSGLEVVESERTGKYSNVEREVLNKITFTIPSDAKPGTYKLTSGRVWQSWFGGISVDGAVGGPEGSLQKDFSILPEINFNVRETAEEDGVKPSISTTIENDSTVETSTYQFKVVVSDNVDNGIIPIVKVNGQVIKEEAGNYKTILEEGKNEIVIEATDLSGNKAVEKYNVNLKIKLREGSGIILNTNNLEMKKGDTHQIIAVDTPDRRSNSDDETAYMKYEVIEGSNVASVDGRGQLKALEAGLAKVSVKYPGLSRPEIIYVNVKDENSNMPIKTSIKETKYDTIYFEGDSYDYDFTVDVNSYAVVKVNNEVIEKNKDGKYTAKLIEGHNFINIAVANNGKTIYKTYNLKAKKTNIEILNLTNPGKEIIQGDKVGVKFKGLETPVPKFLRVFNPIRTRVSYKTTIPRIETIFGAGTQYDIATNNMIEFIATEVGSFEFTEGTINEAWWGNDLFSERDITGEGPNIAAPEFVKEFSTLPSFKIEVKENKNYKDKINTVLENKEELKAGDEVVLKIENLEMPEADRGKILQAYTKFNTNISGVEEITSEDGKDKFENLKTLKFKLPGDIKPGKYTITNGRVFKEWDGGALYDEKEFYKGEIPAIEIEVKDEEEEEIPDIGDVIEPSMTVDEGIKHAIDWIKKNTPNPTFGDEWDILGIVRSGELNNKDYIEKYYNNLEKVVKEKKGNLTKNKYTEYSRVVLASVAIGKNPENIGGYNLLEKLYDYKNVSKQGLNGTIFALIALDSKNYEIPKTATNSREKMINDILKEQLVDGGFALVGNTGNVDVTAMAIQALSRYRERPEVKNTIDKAVNFLSKAQLDNGGYKTDGIENVEASAQTAIALTNVGIDLKDERFIKNKNWIISNIMSFANKKGGFNHERGLNEANDMATEQALIGLVSYKRFIEKKNSIYDMNDVEAGIEKPEGEGGNPSVPNPDIDKPEIEKPQTEKPEIEKPQTEKPQTEKPQTEKPQVNRPVITETSSSKPSNKKEEITDNIELKNDKDNEAETTDLKEMKEEISALRDEINSLKELLKEEENLKLASEKNNQGNMQIIFMALAGIFGLLAIKEIVLKAKKKEENKKG